jgi:hypothetical protein
MGSWWMRGLHGLEGQRFDTGKRGFQIMLFVGFVDWMERGRALGCT